MRRVLITAGLAVALSAGTGTAFAQQSLPGAACNQGTMNAHTRVPERTGKGVPVKAHEHIPEGSGGACQHQ
jgi:hypothetical protein